MRKIYLLTIALLCIVVQGWAEKVVDLSQLRNDKVYTIRSERAFLLFSDKLPGELCTSTGIAVGSVTANQTDPMQQFRIEKNGDDYYLFSVGAQKYVSSNGSYEATASTVLKIEKMDNASYPWKLCLGNNGMNSQSSGQTNSGIMVNDWTIADPGNCYCIEEVQIADDESDFDNTPKFIGKVTDLSQLDNDMIYVLRSERAALLYSAVPEITGNICSTTGTKVGGVTADYSDSNQWFRVEKHGNSYYLYSIGASKYVGDGGAYVATPTTELRIEKKSNANYPWQLYLGSNGMNSQASGNTANGIVINSWITTDPGNCYFIEDVYGGIEGELLAIKSQLALNKEADNTIVGAYKYSAQLYQEVKDLITELRGVNTVEGLEAIFGKYATLRSKLSLQMPIPGRFYVIECPLFKQVSGFARGLYSNPDALRWGNIDYANTKYYWQVEVKDGLYAIKNVNTGKYLKGTGLSDTPDYSSILSLGSQQFNIKSNGITVHANGHNSGNGTDGNIVNWAGSVGSASAWKFVDMPDPTLGKDIELTYHLFYDGIERYSLTVNAKEGLDYPDIHGLPFGVVVNKPEGKIPVNGETDVNLEVKLNLPFKPASKFEDITNWYNITLKRDFYLFYEENDEAIEGSRAVDAQNPDAYAWAFVGNPFDGYQIYNMKAGDGMILSSSTVMKGVTGAETYPVLTKLPVPEINNTHWTASTSSYYTNGFYLAQNDNLNNRMNLRQPNLAYWTGGADAGSTFNVREVESAGAGFYMVVVLGTNDASAGVVYKGQTFKNHSVINAATALSVSSLSAMAVNGMIPSITIDGSKVYVSYFSNSTRFFTLRGGHGGYVSLNSAYQTDGNLRLNNSEEPRDNKALWTFAQQEDGTYMVYNFSTGLSKGLGITGKEANARTRMVSLGDNAYSTKFTGSFDFTGSEPSYIRIDGGNHWWNKRGDYFALWETSDGWNGDTGCKFFISEVDYEDYPDVYFYEVPTIEGVESFVPKNPNTLWYKTSAVAKGVSNPWMEYALPLGNGELGCMVFGGVHNEEIQFNEKTLWSGPANQVGAGSGNRTFMNFGSVIIENRDKAISERVTDYVRYLDIEEGIAGVEFKNNNGSKFTRKYLSSAPDQVIAAQYKAEGADKMNLRFTVEPGKGINASEVDYYMDNNVGVARFMGAMSVSYAARLHVVANPGATVTASAKGITVVNATEVTFYLKGATNFNGDVDAVNNYFTSENVDSKAKVALDAAVAKGFNAIERAHVVNFTTLTNRMSLDLCLETPKRDTETLIKNYQFNDGNSSQNDHLFLEQLYFHYGRYLAISSNRKPIAAPSNLQGIWNNRGTDSPWNSDIHTNINVQMNYWPMESTNLSDLHMPFLNFIIRGAQSDGWKAVADRYNNGYGWSVLTETSLYNSMSTWGDNYLVANAWYTSHLWNHWRYTHNKEFLKKAFPVMWGAAEFWFNRLIKDRGFDSSKDEQESVRNYTPAYSYDPDGSYVAPNEFSAEQHDNQSEDGTAHAQQLISYLFQNLSDALSVLGASEINISLSDISKLNHYLEKIDKGLHTETYTGTWGDTYNGVRKGEKLLREWKYSPYDISTDKGHRHMSHLMALYPLEQITPNSEYFTPAVNSLKLRGDAATGWSMGWKLNLWARALDGDHAHLIMKNALKHSTDYGTNAGAGGVYYNLFDSHAPFQIDGNFGVCAGVAEMLMQSAHGYIHILPALPTVWEREGYVKGMKAVGNFVVDFNWYAGICQGITIRSNAGAPLRVYCKRGAKKLQRASIKVDGQEVMVSVDENGIATIPCEKGSVVTIDFTTTTGLSSVAPDSDENGTSDMYDLSGRRVRSASEGRVYIQNGEKKVAK